MSGCPEGSQEEFFNHLLEDLIVPLLLDRFLQDISSRRRCSRFSRRNSCPHLCRIPAMRCAAYARYSSDLQRQTSIEDQVAVARSFRCVLSSGDDAANSWKIHRNRSCRGTRLEVASYAVPERAARAHVRESFAAAVAGAAPPDHEVAQHPNSGLGLNEQAGTRREDRISPHCGPAPRRRRSRSGSAVPQTDARR